MERDRSDRGEEEKQGVRGMEEKGWMHDQVELFIFPCGKESQEPLTQH